MYSVISGHNLICLGKKRNDGEGLPAFSDLLHLSLFIIFFFFFFLTTYVQPSGGNAGTHVLVSGKTSAPPQHPQLGRTHLLAKVMFGVIKGLNHPNPCLVLSIYGLGFAHL